MKTLFRLTCRGLGSSPLPRIPGLVVTRVYIFLYRDRERRPQEALNPFQDRSAPLCPWHIEHFPSPGKGTHFVVFTDVASLATSQPLRFFAWGFGLHLEGPGLMSVFKKTGGGPAAGPEADAAVLRSLFAALRSFPEGWATRTMDRDDHGKPVPIRETDESHPA